MVGSGLQAFFYAFRPTLLRIDNSMFSHKKRRKLFSVLHIVFANEGKCFAVLEALLSHLNDRRGDMRVSYDTLQEEANCSRATVAKAIQMAEAAGIISILKTYRWAVIDGVRKWVRAVNVYTLHNLPNTTAPEGSLTAEARQALKRTYAALAALRRAGRGCALRFSKPSPVTVQSVNLEAQLTLPALPRIDRPRRFGLIDLA